jgi:hypothetical protein
MSERKIVVPTGMLAAVCDARCVSHRSVVQVILEVALGWLSQNPLVPTSQQAQEILREHRRETGEWPTHPEVCAMWQRRMFLAPKEEVPKEIADMMREGTGIMPFEELNAIILEAYRRGQQFKEKQ